MAKLTKTYIDKAAPPEKGYEIHWDDSLKGYGLRVTAAGKKTFVAQGRVRGIVRALINYAGRRYKKADGTALITNNPVLALKDDWVKLESRDTRIPDKKVGAVWHMLTTSRANAYNRDTLASIDLVMFLILTGARIGEASALTWDRVNLDEAWWHIPDPKNSNPVWLPLSTQAVALLKIRQRVNGSPFVFASWGKCGHLRDPRDTMKKLSESAGLHLSPHDLRRSFTTIGIAMCRLDILKVELLTNHKPKSVTAKHYLETKHLQYLLPEVQAIADWVEQQAATAGGSNVVQLRA